MSKDKTASIEEEDLPIHKRPRVKAWAASKMGSVPRPVLGSSDRALLLQSAKRLDADADAIYEKIKALRREAELLREEAFQKRVLCAPICSIPPETLSQILQLTTPEGFAFRPEASTDAHPLSGVSRDWRHTIETTPEIWSKIDIRLPGSYHSDVLWRDVERRLPPWLARAGDTNLNVTFELGPTGMLDPLSDPLQAVWTKSQPIWLMLLSLVGNWQEVSYRGTSTFLNQFWAKAQSAVRLKTASLHVNDAHQDTENLADLKPLACNLDLFPRLQTLVLSSYFPPAIMRARLPFATRLQALTLRNFDLSESGLAGLAASFPFVTRLHLEDVAPPASKPATSHTVAFESLERFELSSSISSEEATVLPLLPALPAMQECRALKSLRLQLAEFSVSEGSHPLPSVERLELGLPKYLDYAEPDRRLLFRMLPSLRSLKVTPIGPAWRICPGKTLQEELLLSVQNQEGDDEPLLCPQLSEIFFQRVALSNLMLVAFIESRTFTASLHSLKILNESYEDFWQQEDPTNRSTRYGQWKPTCVVITSRCPGTPDMVNAGLEVLADNIKSGKLKLSGSGKDDLKCADGCDCDCGDAGCPCCEHLGASDEEDFENHLGDENFPNEEDFLNDDELDNLFVNGF